MAHSSHARSNILMNLFNLPSLTDQRRSAMMICDFPKDFYIPDGKNSKRSQIITKWVFDRQTPDGNEGVGIKIPYLECAYSTRYYVIDTINGNINAIHNKKIKPTDFFGCSSPFNLRELEFDVCRIVDRHNSEDDSRLDEERRQVPQEEAPAPPQSAQLRPLRPFHELRDMTHEGQVFSMEQCTNLNFITFIEVLKDLIESFQMYSMQILNQPESAAEIRSRQSEQAAYYGNIIKNIDIVLQLDQVACIHEGFPQVPSPRYVQS